MKLREALRRLKKAKMDAAQELGTAEDDVIRAQEKLRNIKEKQRINLKQARENMYSACTRLKRENILELANICYWSWEFPREEIIEGFKLYEQKWLKPHNLLLPCRTCGEKITKVVRSRTEKTHVGRFTYTCKNCQEAEQKMLDEKHLHEQEKRRIPSGYRTSISITRINELHTMPYQEYLQTDEWKETRNSALHRAHYRCQLCNGNGQLHVHHSNYANRGNEYPSDLIVLCAPCHQKFHDKVGVAT